MASSPRPTISPTDISRFVLLDQCQRFLKLRFRQKLEGDGFLDDFGVTLQQIPPLLSRSGSRFERSIEATAVSAGQVTLIDAAARRLEGRANDNDRLVAIAHGAAPGSSVHLVFQPRIDASIGYWNLRGDVDIVRFHRDAAGRLDVLITDMKSSPGPKIDHRLQVSFYHEMMRAIFADAGEPIHSIGLGVLYKGPADRGASLDDETRQRLAEEAADARTTFGTDRAYLHRIADPTPYLWSVRDLVTAPDSLADRVLAMDEGDVPFHLTSTCDGCVYNEHCMKWSAQTDNLSLIPSITLQDKTALERSGVSTIHQLATLKRLDGTSLQDVQSSEQLASELAGTWPVGPRLDELIHRAKQYRRFRDRTTPALAWIPSRGASTLPWTAPDHNPNLVRIHIDVQFDHLQQRVYMLGALVTGCVNGAVDLSRRRHIVRITASAPERPEQEEALILDWLTSVLEAVVGVAAPDADGGATAPIHVIFYNSYAQRMLLEALSRHFETIFGATALYDFVTQVSGMDSPVVTYLDRELQRLRNLPMVTQSLQAVAEFMKFEWGESRERFHSRHFDFRRRMDEEALAEGEVEFYTGRARFNSQIPLEYAYAAWDDLPDSDGTDHFASFRNVAPDDMTAYQHRRLDAIEHIAASFTGNRETRLSPFVLPDLAAFEGRARSLAQALAEFMAIERHLDLFEWKRLRVQAPEDRVLTGGTLVVRYVEADQLPGVAEQNRDNAHRHQLATTFREAFKAANPDKSRVTLTAEQKRASSWEHADTRYRLRIEPADIACSLDDILRITTFDEGDWAILAPRTDSFVNEAGETIVFTPTAKSLLRGSRMIIEAIDKAPEGTHAWVEIRAAGYSHDDGRGYTFQSSPPLPFDPDRVYTIDTDVNDRNGGNIVKVVDGLVKRAPDRLYDLLTQPEPAPVYWPDTARAGQQRFLAGLDALRAAGVMHAFEESKRRYIGGTGDEPLLVVQGPPGTGKSYSTALAILARMQGAMDADLDYRVMISSKTHAAIDVLLGNLLTARQWLVQVHRDHPDIFAAHFNPRLMEIDLFRMTPKNPNPDVIRLYRKRDAPSGHKPVEMIRASRWCAIGSTPSGVWGMLTDAANKNEFGLKFIDCIVMDEASQMSLPEAMAASMPVTTTGQAIVVGDHRQMAPIVRNDWQGEQRRTFAAFRAFASLFEAALERTSARIPFEESFRLHRDMAAFLGREIYAKDKIAFHSRRNDVLEALEVDDPFVAAALDPAHPITLIVHGEGGSMKRNVFEQELIRPLVDVLHHRLVLDAVEGLGVVVPHTSQRAGLLADVPLLTGYHPDTGVQVTSVDTVERYQGDERDVIIISATESSREYLLVAGKFLMDPRRLNVALSRARKKLILIAAQSVFEIFSADEEMFDNAQLWKNLLRRTCTQELWRGEREGHTVTVWGNRSPS